MKHAAFVALVAFSLVPPALASDTVDHYAPQPSATLEDALANFTSHNAHLAAILDKPDLSADDMEDIHQLTYTLEDALAKMIAESTAIAVQLEIVHHWSESTNAARLKEHAQTYLEMAGKLVR